MLIDRRLRFLYLFGPLVAFARSGLYLFLYLYDGKPIEWGRLASDFFARSGWIVLTPLVIAAARRWPLGRVVWRRNFPLQLLAMLGCVALLNAGYLAVRLLMDAAAIGEPYQIARLIRYYFSGSVLIDLLIYWVVVGWVMAQDYLRNFRLGELRAARLQSEVASAQLAALQRQLNPHFLFNTLNSVATLIHSDPAAADAMVVRLGSLLRMSLAAELRQEVPLEQELDLLHAFLAIEKARFADRLQVDERIEPATRAALVPTLVLQPLVENALRHGGLTKRGHGRVVIDAERLDGRLVLQVVDDGDLPAGLAPAKPGVGLTNTRERLRALYSEAFSFTAEPVAGTGFRCRLEIPWRVAAED